uniref:Uncharacterized protein n=1 Tax=Arundo donax TaxID=35708 RepID=A0A0A9FUL9_ARUDO
MLKPYPEGKQMIIPRISTYTLATYQLIVEVAVYHRVPRIN